MKKILKRTMGIVTVLALSGCLTAFAKDSLYDTGQKQLDNKEWNAAQQSFAAIVAQKGDKQDAALYWLAYASFKNNQSQAALNAIKQLSKDFPKSRWLDDAEALKIEIQDKNGNVSEIDDDEMKLYAIDSLMNSSSQKAVSVLSKILSGNSSDKIKKRALFVLSQTDSPEAYSEIAKLASDDKNQSLQISAIEMLGVSGSQQALALLKDVYSKSTNLQVKEKVLNSYMVADQTDVLYALASSEPEPQLKSQAIHLLGAMDASDVLAKMYHDKAFKEQREAILTGLMISDASDAILSIVKTETDERLLLIAIKQLGIMDVAQTGQSLVDLYQQQSSHEVRMAIIDALFIQDNVKALLGIIRTEKDAGLKRAALQRLSNMDSDEAVNYFSKLLDKQE